MAKSYYGSIDYDKLLNDLKAGRLKTYKNEKGTRYINVQVYLNDQPDQFGQHGSLAVPLKEEFHTEVAGKKQNKLYIGNLKESTPKISEATAEDFQDGDEDDVPF